MKKYSIGGSKAQVISITIADVLIMLLVMVPMLMIFEDGFGNDLLIFVPILLACDGFLIFITINVIKQYTRKQTALKGHRTTGVITNSYVSKTRYGSSGKVEIQYKTESGEDALLCTLLMPDRLRYFQIGNEIPLYVNGEYAYFKDEEIYGNTDAFDRKVEGAHSESNYHHEEKSNNKFTFCPYCGASLKKNTDRCPHCRSKLM